MKKNYILLIFALSCLIGQAQTFDFSIEFRGINGGTNNYQFALLATPSATITDGNTADMGAGFYVPAGLTIGNFVTGNSNLPASEWSSQVLGATNANGDSFFLSRVEAGSSSVLLNGEGPFELVLFDVIADPNPTSGEITFVENGDPVFDELLFIENYININLGAGTTNAYNQNDPAASTILFDTLSTEGVVLVDVNLQLYPNPTQDIAYIKTALTIDLVEVFDVTGKLVNNFTSKTIDMSTMNAGVYFLKIHAQDKLMVKRLIKE